MLVYIDESGDLGWVFDKPYRSGGSSRYLTISSLIVPENLKFHPKRVIIDLYKKCGISPTKEIKGFDLNAEQISFFTNKAIKLFQNHIQIRVESITVKKENVQDHIRLDSNKLYNYMIGLSLLEEIKTESNVVLMPDPRSIKVKSGNSMLDYLQTMLWFALGSKTKLTTQPVTSDRCDNIKFIDIITHILWKGYEDHDEHFSKLIIPFIKQKHLFF